jgi:hypothetical protein
MVHKIAASAVVILGLVLSYFCWLGAAMSSRGGSVWELVGIPLAFILGVAALGVVYWCWIVFR